jgi:hypothetical protein
MSVARSLFGVAGTTLFVAALVALSAAPVEQPRAGRSQVRLSWRARPERIETCRAVSHEELEKQEEHMRQRVECAGRSATYLLRVESDGTVLHESVAVGGGLRHDRPLFILREIEIPPGGHRLRVTFARRERSDGDTAAFTSAPDDAADSGLFAGRAQREAAERSRRARAAVPPLLQLDTTLDVAPGRTAVVSFDAVSRRLRVSTTR